MTDIAVAVYIGGALVAAWVQFLANPADESGESETLLNLALIFLWPIMMLITIPFAIRDDIQASKKDEEHE